MTKVMLTVKLKPRDASVQKVQRKLKLRDEDIDRDFGVVSIDPDQDLYAVLVEESAAGEAAAGEDVGGPFANPPIEPFGPVQHNARRKSARS